MKRTKSKTAYIRKRIKTIQNRAKFVGVFYLLGSLALAVAVLCLPLLNGTKLGANDALLPILTFYQPFMAMFEGGFGNLLGNINAMSAADFGGLLSALFYVFLLLAVVFNGLRSFKRLNWLFKRRASYTNGFNRNMYAMDSLGKRFSGSLAAIVIFYLFIYVFSFDGDYPTVTMYGYAVLGGGLLLHFLMGLIGGTVTLFTIGENVAEEPREFGLFTYFVRNVMQLAAIAGILYFLLPNSVVAAKLPVILQSVIGGNVMAIVNVPVLVEVAAWICLLIMIKHATAATEFNRDCMDGVGMKNFRIFSFFATVALVAVALLPMLGFTVVAGEKGVNLQLIFAAAVSFVAFLLDCIIKSRNGKENCDDLGIEDYLQGGGESKYNNTII